METYQAIKAKYSGLTENEFIEIIAKLTGEISTLRTMLFTPKRERFSQTKMASLHCLTK